MQNTATPELSQYYYHDNFLHMLAVVERRDWDLLNEDERQWIQVFNTLSPNAQRLMVRLLSRKGEWFRRDKISYPEITSIEDAQKELECTQMILVSDTVPTEIACRLLRKDEMPQAFPDIKLAKTARKSEWESAVQALSDTQIVLPTEAVFVRNNDVIFTLLLLYFGNSRQDLTQFVVADLGIQRFENYPLNQQERLFQNRKDVESWLFLADLNEQYWQASQAKTRSAILELASLLPEPFDWKPLERKRQKLANNIAREFERSGLLEQALSMYQTTSLPPSRERQTRIHISEGRYDVASKIVAEMAAKPINEDERDCSFRLNKKLPHTHRLSLAVAPLPEQKTISIDLPKSQDRVEVAAAKYFSTQGWQVWYSENSLLNALFGLFFWDIIFSSSSGAFLNPYQRSPRDMFSSTFAESRMEKITKRFSDISAVRDIVLSRYEQKLGIANDWVNWPLVDKTLLATALDALTPSQISAVFERILFDPRVNRAGHPDLFMVRGDTYQWVEIKGPDDRLQYNQKRWLSFFHEQRIHACVCHISFS